MTATVRTTPPVDPLILLETSPMTVRQMLAVAICFCLTALDGFDVLSISFAAPGIAREWGINSTALGIVLSMELIGMASGSILFGQVADRLGRKPTALGCLSIMAIGMILTTQSGSITALSLTRLMTGLGIGGMLATTNALAAEYVNSKNRGTAVAVMAAGFPMGAVVGGTIASALLATEGWRSVFYLGAAASAAFLPVIALFMPESIGWLTQRGGAAALLRINRALLTLGKPTVHALAEEQNDPSDEKGSKRSLSEIRRPLTLLTIAYLLHIMTFYFVQKWIPKVVADMGFSSSSAGQVLVWANVGGLFGAMTFSVLSIRFAIRPLLICSMILAALTVMIFGYSSAHLIQLSLAAATSGFFTNAGVVGLYAMTALSFPTDVRARASGLVLGIGRGGSALSPIIGGFLFSSGFGFSHVATFMALGSLLGSAFIFAAHRHRD